MTEKVVPYYLNIVDQYCHELRREGHRQSWYQKRKELEMEEQQQVARQVVEEEER